MSIDTFGDLHRIPAEHEMMAKVMLASLDIESALYTENPAILSLQTDMVAAWMDILGFLKLANMDSSLDTRIISEWAKGHHLFSSLHTISTAASTILRHQPQSIIANKIIHITEEFHDCYAEFSNVHQH